MIAERALLPDEILNQVSPFDLHPDHYERHLLSDISTPESQKEKKDFKLFSFLDQFEFTEDLKNSQAISDLVDDIVVAHHDRVGVRESSVDTD